MKNTNTNMTNMIVKNFNSINEFLKYLEKNSYNKVFENYTQSSIEGEFSFTGTRNYDEAIDLLKHGWNEKAKEIENKLKADKKVIANNKSQKSVYDVVGYQPSVPRYLQGIPTNMINNKPTIKKQPVVTLIKNIGYNAYTSKGEILNESIKALKIIQRIEQSGIKVNLDLIKCTESNNNNKSEKQDMMTRIRIKNANERLNISKLAFPLAHPSMLRRIMFAYTEKCQELTDFSYRNGYGRSRNTIEEIKKWMKSANKAKKDNEYVIPGFINENIEKAIEEIGLKIK